MQDLDDLHLRVPHSVDHLVPVAGGDLIAQGRSVDHAAHLGVLGDQRHEALDLGQHGIGGRRVQGAKVVVLHGQAGEGVGRPERLSHAGRRGRPRPEGQRVRKARRRSGAGGRVRRP